MKVRFVIEVYRVLTSYSLLSNYQYSEEIFCLCLRVTNAAGSSELLETTKRNTALFVTTGRKRNRF